MVGLQSSGKRSLSSQPSKGKARGVLVTQERWAPEAKDHGARAGDTGTVGRIPVVGYRVSRLTATGSKATAGAGLV